MFDPMNNKIVINIDMVISEIEEWDWRNSDKKDSMRIMYEKSSSDAEVHTQADTNRPQRTRNMQARLQEYVVTPVGILNR